MKKRSRNLKQKSEARKLLDELTSCSSSIFSALKENKEALEGLNQSLEIIKSEK
jgi:hypothetical protein